MKKLFLLLFALSQYTISSAQYLLIEKYEPKDMAGNGQSNTLKIPFSKYNLNNGLTLIVSEDHSSPIVNINITYKVGSSNDYADRTGMAYMIYKLMDKGSKHLHNGEYQNTIKQYGGKIYSQITRDRTSFSVTVPKNLLATVLWMESDRQAYFLDSLTQEKFDNTKLDIIASMYDSLYHQKYGLPDVLAQKNMYVFGHPYTWPEFGMMDHYQAFTITDLKKYFLDWYGTNNTIVTITGDVKTQEVVDMVNAYFGTLTKATQSSANIDELFNRITGSGGIEFTEPRYISYKIDVPYPLLKIVFNTVPKFNQDEKALNIMAYLLGQGNKSILYNELVRKGYAVSVNAQHKTYKHLGEFTIDVMAKPDTSLAVILAKINTILNDIANRRNLAAYVSNVTNSNYISVPENLQQQNIPPKQNPLQPVTSPRQVVPAVNRPIVQPRSKELENKEELIFNQTQSTDILFQATSKFKNDEIRLLESVQNKGNALAERELITGKPENISPSLIEYNEIYVDKFFALFNKYLLTGAKLYVSIVPKDKEYLIVAHDNIVERELKTILTPTLDQDLVYRFPAKEINKKKPKVTDLPFSPNIVVKTDSTQNGMLVSLVQDNNFTFVSFNIRMDATKVMKLLPQLDVPRLLATRYTEWFENQGLVNPLKAASLSGSSVEFVSSGQYVDIHIICPKEQVMNMKESILHFFISPEYNLNTLFPMFVKNINDSFTLKNFRKSDLCMVVNNLSRNYGSLLTLENSFQNNPESPGFRQMLSTAFSKMSSPDNMSSFTYGNIDMGLYQDYYMRLSTWNAPEFIPNRTNEEILNPDQINEKDPKLLSDGNIFLLRDESKETAKIIVEYMQIPVEASTNYYTGQLANYVFGLASTNQINKNLANRDYIQKIKTISYYRNKMECFAVILTVNPDKIYDAYNDLLKELDNFKTFKPEKRYFKSAMNEYIYKDIVNYETFSQKELFIKKMISNKIPAEIFNNQYALTKKIKASGIEKFWKASYDPAKARIVVIGNQDQIKGNISKTGKTIIIIDNSGTVIN